MSGPTEEERLKRLSERLAARGKAQQPEDRKVDTHAQAQQAWRMVTELVAGLLVGFGIGLGLDALFGTQPWLMMIFTLLGFAAGVQTMLRTSREMQRAQAASERDREGGQGG